nr:PREDICTED: MAM and LDL-receptor class A domain-containing protein 2-like isoform X3 [Megachile rotundata]
MKISLTPLLLWTLFLAQCVVSYVSVQNRCPVVRLANGKVRGRARGRIIRFSCYEGFILVGNKYSTCIRGQWDTPTPVCVNAACAPPPVPEHAMIGTKYNGAILLFFCQPGYALIGSPEIYCNGMQWNGTTPHCRDTTAAAPTECNFEKPDLCWWEQDPQHDFDWRRHNFQTPSSHIGTGPTHDHTLGPGNDGYYLYIEASGRLENDTARIISPIYNASYTDDGCFSFWYHMFGGTIGALNVYFKAEKDPWPRLMFSKEGDQGNQWFHGIFNLPKAEKGFQIIIEGVRGKNYVSDIAIDDVAILQGDKCREASKTESDGVTEGDEDQIEQVNAQQSCRGRCKNSVTYSFTTAMPPTLSDACLCTLDCAEHSICCPDYAEYCVLGYTEEGTNAEPTTGTHITQGPSIIYKEKITTLSDMAVWTGFYDHKDSNSRLQDAEKLHRASRKFSLSGIIGIIVGIITGIAVSSMVVIIILRRRKTCKRGANGSALSEDSDVRFLTSDEILDFTLARPSDNDET